MTFRLLVISCAWLVSFALNGHAQTVANPATQPARPFPQIQHVCIISIDGLRPDRALLADMPNLRKLLKAGSYTFWARTTPNSITLPSHVSMLSGVSPRKHGVEWNRDLPFTEPVYPLVPTIFELAKQAGYSTAVIAGKSKFAIFDKPGALTYSAISKPDSDNAAVAQAATRIIEEHKPDLFFIHFPDVDHFGHKNGWGSPEQLAAIDETDVHLGEIFAAIDRAGIRESTFIIVTADHGGAGRSHGPDDFRSRYIPWIAVGPGVRAGFDLTQIASLEVNTEDSAATALYLLGVKLPPYFEGKPVAAIFEQKR
ncbi:MAG TPA: ectonucleotide pyrophosphatase/phosphodiesterase [Opitutaceae bacterium]|nr:ectonucleotide pyrophosphatase/phosphodiesterase [Opitutaceae bacterium]